MPNEIEIVITSEDKSAAGVAGANKNVKQLGASVDDTGKKVEATQGRFGRMGSTLASTNRVGDATKETWKGIGVGVAGAAVAWAAANKVMNDGIAIGLKTANAQVALGDNYGKLQVAAEQNAHAIGLTTSEYEAAAGMTASLAKNMGFATDVAVQFGMLMPDLSQKLSLLSNGQRSASETGDMMRAAIAGEFDPLQTLGINISAAVVAQKALSLQQENGKKFTDQQANALAVLSIVQDQTADSTKVLATEQGRAAMEAQKNSAEMRQAWQDLEKAAVPVLSAITGYVGDTLGAIVDLKAAITGEQGLGGGFKTLVNAAIPMTNIFDKFIGGTKGEGDAAKDAAPKIGDLAKQQTGGAQSAADMAKATDMATDAILDLSDAALGGRDANREWEKALDDAEAALKENGKTLDVTTEKGRNNEEALDDIAKAALGQAEAIRAAGGSEAQFRGKLEQSRSSLIKAAQQFGMTKAEARRYADQILGIPRNANTNIKLETQQALGALAYLRGRIRALDGSYIQVRARAVLDDSAIRGIATGGVQGAASGGARSRMTWVGEHGPELVNLPPGSRVHSNPDSQRMVEQAAGSGGGAQTVVLEFRSDDPGLLTLLRKMVRVYGGKGADNVQVAFGGR